MSAGKLLFEVVSMEGKLNANFAQYVTVWGARKYKKKVRVISVAGPESSGKKTLLNALFQTGFPTLDGSGKYQETNGLWIGEEDENADAAEQLLILKIEGFGSNAKTFESRGTPLAIGLSSVIMINIFETSVGFSFGLNKPLLQSILTASLRFKVNTFEKEKKVLWFILRNCKDSTVMSVARITLGKMVLDVWGQIPKPAGKEKLQLRDMFEVVIRPFPDIMPHGVLEVQPVDELRQCFNPGHENYIFRGKDRLVYKDAKEMTLFAQRLFKKIDGSKDVDAEAELASAKKGEDPGGC